MRKFFKTVLQVTILSEDQPVGDGLSLDIVHEEITTWGCSGQIKTVSKEEVSPKEAVRLLQEQGSDPEFFALDAEGRPMEV